jgi:DNA polymerase III delta prime subunit
MAVANTLWTERYRPQKLEDYVWINDEQRRQVEGWVKDRDIPHVLLSGGPGCGKSTLAKLMMVELGVSNGDIKFVNASHHRGIDFIRDLSGFAETMPSGDYRYVILDEADRLTPEAQDALKSMIEEYSSICRWILTTNRPHKITGPLHSRTQGFHVEALDREQFVTRVATILITEGVDLNEENLEILDEYVTVTYPDLRKCLNMLQQNCRDGQLRRPKAGGGKGIAEYMIEAVALFKNGHIHEARKIICANAGESDYEEIYRLLYRNLDWWGKDEESQNKAIVIIANRLRDHSMVADPEIAMAACLVELSMV